MFRLPGRNADDVPVLETDRLTMRCPQLSDYEDLCNLWSNQSFVEFIGGKPRPRSIIWQVLQRHIGAWSLLGFGYWVITERTTGRFVGEAGFLLGKRGMAPPLPDVPEAGWGIHPNFWGQGIATEAVTAAHDWMDAQTPKTSTVCIIDPRHTVSKHLAHKLGYESQGMSLFEGSEIETFRRH